MDEAQIRSMVENVERKFGYKFSKSEVSEVLSLTRRKCEINGEGERYAPVLFEHELKQYIARECINQISSLRRSIRTA